MTIYERIKERREQLGMSQQELADAIGLKSRSSINKIESGINDISKTKIVAIAEALNTSAAYLMGIGIGKKIRILRKKHNVSIDDLATKLGVSQSTILRYENETSEIPSDKLESLCDIFNCSLQYLFDGNLPFGEFYPWESDTSVLPENIITLAAKNDKRTATNTIRIAGRDGSFIERQLTDDQIDLLQRMIKQMPDFED